MSSLKPERFDDSFVIRMIRDFFLVLLGVIIIELGLRFGLVLYDFQVQKKKTAEITAERLAADVKSIMLNRGGPVAARTLYPILKKDHENLGLAVAIEPSQATIQSIKNVFDFTPKGIPAEWPAGRYQDSKVEIHAEEFCIQCHISAKPGDVLGQVEVRSYLSTQLQHWWKEVRLTTTLGMGKILLHTVILFLLLKVRMEPLLALQSTVSVLAKAGTRLSHRAPIRSNDEFGELARDLNLFLDRVSHVIEDLSAVLTKIVALNQRLTQVHDQMADHFKSIDDKMTRVTRQAFEGRKGEPLLSTEWVESVDVTLSVMQALHTDGALTREQGEKIERLSKQLRETASRSQTVFRGFETVGTGLIDLSNSQRGFSHWLEEMAVIEEKMEGISEQGQTLLDRLKGSDTT
ncbi:MAG: HAMP domain-containing protein [Acidiferrobacterales bacterium]